MATEMVVMVDQGSVYQLVSSQLPAPLMTTRDTSIMQVPLY